MQFGWLEPAHPHHSDSLSVEVPLGTEVGLDEPSAVKADGLHTISQRRLTRRVGTVDDEVLTDICSAVAVALGSGTL